MDDFTLIIPTHNRSQLFAALLAYLEAEKAACRVLVLDSSRPEAMAANRQRVAASSLEIDFRDLANLAPTEKWRQGFHKVSTPLCALCADDDLVILDGVRRCLEELRENPAASVVQGHSFSFLHRPDGDIELTNLVYFTPSITERKPLQRLASLFAQYQAPSYGIFRTHTLQRIFDTLQPITSTLARELLWSALAVIEGEIIRLPDFSYGRSIGPSSTYEFWHPLEWLCKNPESLLEEYVRYRALLENAVMQRRDNDQRLKDVREILDCIHMLYLLKHAPGSALEYITQQQIAGVDFADYWPSYEIHVPLYAAARVGASPTSEPLDPVNLRGRGRSYVACPGFYSPAGTAPLELQKIVRLIGTLDKYQPLTSADTGRQQG